MFSNMDVLLAQGSVRAYILPFPDGSEVKVLGWISEKPGQGNTKVALLELRRQFKSVTAFNVSGPAVDYWGHMHKLGFVDKVCDDCGETIYG